MSFRITQQEVTGWCQHDSFSAKFSPKTNAIIGNNGSGKSNFFNAGVTALTGDCVVGTIEDNIKFDRDKAEIVQGFMINGVGGEVRRTFSGKLATRQDPLTGETKTYRPDIKTTATLTFGGETVTGVKAVNAKLAVLLGLSKQVLSDHVFVPQTDLSKMLKVTSASRLDTFLKMLPGVGVAEMRSANIAEELRRFPLIEVGVSIDQLKQQAADRLTALSTVRAESEEVGGTLAQTDWAAQTRVLEDAAVAERARQRTSQLYVSLDSETRKNSEISQQHQLAVSEFQLVQTAEAGIRADIQQTKQNLNNLESLSRQKATYDAAVRQVQSLEATLGSLKAPEKQEDPTAGIEKLRSELGLHEAELTAAQRMVTFLSSWKGGALICPTCTTQITDPASALATNKAIINDLSPRRFQLQKEIADRTQVFQKYTYTLNSYSSQMAAATAQLKQAREMLAAQQPVTLPADEQVAAWRKDVAEYAQLEADVQKIWNTSQQLLGRLQTSNALIAQLNSQIADMASDLARCPDASAVSTAKLELERKRELDARKARLQGIEEATQGEYSRMLAEIAKVEEIQKRAETVRSYHKILEGSRELLHRDKLPKEVFSAFLTSLNYWCNKFLGDFGRPFAVSVDKNMDITCAFTSGYVSGCERLSGGQACVLSVALRFATNRMFAQQMGMLALDEPTEYMDANNRVLMAEFMREVQTLCSTSELQTIIITHAPEILPAFDNVITVPATKEAT